MEETNHRPAPLPLVYLFAGQGSQYFGMGRELYENNPTFRGCMGQCSAAVEARIGVGLEEVVYAPRADRFAPFDRTLLTHPAVFAFNYSVAQTLVAEGLTPHALVGYSLGEYVAWTVGGMLDLEEMLEVVIEMAELIEAHTDPGGLLAVLAAPALFADISAEFHGIELASYNYADNFVISGPAAELDRIAERLREQKITTQALPIRHGFHSALLDPMREPFLHMMRKVRFRPPALPIFSARAGRRVDAADLTPEFCWSVLRDAVDFPAVVAAVEAELPGTYVDVGPSGTLAAFARIVLGAEGHGRVLPVVNQFGRDLEGLEKVRTAARRGNT